ncbi:hypothetical protein BDR26DRAFT_1012231 [Obelidium mucronatum]|nr:hypothetical protein BDR26DRAFT_1012231 [Obelidium mucronatum]
MNSRLPFLRYSRAVLQHGIELLVLCAGVSVRSLQWIETDTPETFNVDCDGYIAGNAAAIIDNADTNEESRREAALISLYRLTDALSRLQDINNPNGPRTYEGSLDDLDGYEPADPPAILDLAAIKEYSRTVGCNDTYHHALLVLDESLTHIARIVLASFEFVKQAKFYNVIVDQNSNFEANVKALAKISAMNCPVPSTPVVLTDAFIHNMKGFNALAGFADAITTQTPDAFLQDTDPFFCVAEYFNSSPDSRPTFTLEICDRTTPVKKWMERKIEMGAVFEFFDFDLDWNGKDPTDTVGADVVVRFADKTTLRGVVSVVMSKGRPLKFVFGFPISKCTPSDFGWEHVYPAGYWGLNVEN